MCSLGVVAVCASSAIAGVGTSATQPSTVVTLTPGIAVERAIAKDQQHEYEIAIDAGHGLKVVVDQLGADVELALDTLIVDDTSKRRYGRELLVWLAPTSGSARVRIRASSVIGAARRASQRSPTRSRSGSRRARSCARAAVVSSQGIPSSRLDMPCAGAF
jgi:hypothetical protein